MYMQRSDSRVQLPLRRNRVWREIPLSKQRSGTRVLI